MPSGKTHDKINVSFLIAILMGALIVGAISLEFMLFFVSGYLFGTFFFGPDLDTKSALFRRWGIFRYLWVPYQKIFTHRSIFTHWFVLGDVLRMVYMVLWLAPFIFVFRAPIIEWISSSYEPYKWSIWCFPIGIVLSSSIHIMSDVLNSNLKKLFK